MKRDIQRLSNQVYDVVIVGAGIYGAVAAWDAALRGLSVALIDRGDFGCGTSANSLKTIHGGLRYLQQIDVKRMRESIRERRVLMHIAPHLVHPLPCIMPTYGHTMKGKEVMRIGMWMNDLISFDRNRLDDPEKRIPRGRVISMGECKKWIPQIDSSRFNGGALWYDAQIYNSDRMIISFVLSAAREGASVVNYVEATRFLLKNQKVIGIQACDQLSGQEFEIQAKVVLNCCGGWVDRLLNQINNGSLRKRFRLSTALNLVVNRRLFPDSAIGIPSQFTFHRPDDTLYRGSRVLFFSPWRQFTLIGTRHRPYHEDPDKKQVHEEEIQEFLNEANNAFPSASIRREEISFFHKGFLPMNGVHPKTGEVRLTKHYFIYDHYRDDGIDGLITVVGVKYTTARDVAEKAVDIISKKLGKKLIPCQSHQTRLAGGDIEHFDDYLKDARHYYSGRLNPAVIDHLVYNYGSECKRILQYGDEKLDVIGIVPGSKEVLIAEVIHAVREEMAQKLTDVILRRTDLGSGQCPEDVTIRACAEIMAGECRWNKERMNREIEETKAVYIPHEI